MGLEKVGWRATRERLKCVLPGCPGEHGCGSKGITCNPFLMVVVDLSPHHSLTHHPGITVVGKVMCVFNTHTKWQDTKLLHNV